MLTDDRKIEIAREGLEIAKLGGRAVMFMRLDSHTDFAGYRGFTRICYVF